MTKWIAFGLLIGSALVAAAQTVTPQIGGGIGFSFDGGISWMKPASSPPPSMCNGTADYSQGCALLGGL